MSDLYEMMSTLRAVRRLKPDPIPDDVLDRVLQAACWAPTGGNVQPWRIIVVRSPERKQALADVYGPEWHKYVGFSRPRALKAGVAGEELAKLERTLAAGDYLADHLAEAPALLLFIADPANMAITDKNLDRDLDGRRRLGLHGRSEHDARVSSRRPRLCPHDVALPARTRREGSPGNPSELGDARARADRVSDLEGSWNDHPQRPERSCVRRRVRRVVEWLTELSSAMSPLRGADALESARPPGRLAGVGQLTVILSDLAVAWLRTFDPTTCSPNEAPTNAIALPRAGPSNAGVDRAIRPTARRRTASRHDKPGPHIHRGPRRREGGRFSRGCARTRSDTAGQVPSGRGR